MTLKDTTSLNSDVPDFLENINQPIDGLKIGIIKEFNLGDLDSSSTSTVLRSQEKPMRP